MGKTVKTMIGSSLRPLSLEDVHKGSKDIRARDNANGFVFSIHNEHAVHSSKTQQS